MKTAKYVVLWILVLLAIPWGLGAMMNYLVWVRDVLQ
jgi:hypothetical protein